MMPVAMNSTDYSQLHMGIPKEIDLMKKGYEARVAAQVEKQAVAMLVEMAKAHGMVLTPANEPTGEHALTTKSTHEHKT